MRLNAFGFQSAFGDLYLLEGFQSVFGGVYGENGTIPQGIGSLQFFRPGASFGSERKN